MIAEQMASKLRDAASSVLDMMCSAPVLADEEFPPAGCIDPMFVGLDFIGEATGKFAMAVEWPVAESLARKFLGNSAPMSRREVVEVLGELANMLCGHLLGQLSYKETFTLSPPKELDRAEVVRIHQNPAGQSYQRSVHISAGVLTMNVIIDRDAENQ